MKSFFQKTIMSALLVCFIFSVSAEQLQVPEAPSEAARWMPGNVSDFGSGIMKMLRRVLPFIRLELSSAANASLSVFVCVIIISVLQCFGTSVHSAELAGAVCISINLLRNSGTMILLAADTIGEIGEYSDCVGMAFVFHEMQKTVVFFGNCDTINKSMPCYCMAII